MAASFADSPMPLRTKLSRVKCLLEDANKQLQEEATKYEIFTTKTSAGMVNNHQNMDKQLNLIKTMSDINTLKTVLSCPIFNRIVNVTDSLDKISYANLTNITQNDDPVDTMDGSVDSKSNDTEEDAPAPEIERIKVTLEGKDFGITVAGYTAEVEDQDCSGLFIRDLTPGGPADLTGKFRKHDQICAVNGKDLLGYRNAEALEELKRAGNVVTFELIRPLGESKFKKLQSTLENVDFTASLKNTTLEKNVQTPSSSTSLTRSSIPVLESHDNNNHSPVISPSSCLPYVDGPTPTYVQVMSNSCGQNTPTPESIQKYESIYTNGNHNSLILNVNNQIPHENSQCHIPIAAQRTNKVIETKQGARNTVEIKSPLCQPTAATYVNQMNKGEFFNSSSSTGSNHHSVVKKSLTARLESEASASDRINLSESNRLIRPEELDWEKDAQIIELYKDPIQGLGFKVNHYTNPKDRKQLIIMITAITPGGIANRDGRLEIGDLLIFVDDVDLQGADLNAATRELKKANGLVRLGILKLIRNGLDRFDLLPQTEH